MNYQTVTVNVTAPLYSSTIAVGSVVGGLVAVGAALAAAPELEHEEELEEEEEQLLLLLGAA